MVDRPFFSAATADRIRAISRRGQATDMLLWRDAYTIRRTHRPEGWDSGTDPEDVTEPESGICQLVSNGPGPGDTQDAVIVGLTPYRVKIPAATTLDAATDLLVINGREFLVESVARGGENQRIVEAAITERNGGTTW